LGLARNLIADMTTGDPNATRAMTAELAGKRITLFDASLSGGTHEADAGSTRAIISSS